MVFSYFRPKPANRIVLRAALVTSNIVGESVFISNRFTKIIKNIEKRIRKHHKMMKNNKKSKFNFFPKSKSLKIILFKILI